MNWKSEQFPHGWEYVARDASGYIVGSIQFLIGTVSGAAWIEARHYDGPDHYGDTLLSHMIGQSGLSTRRRALEIASNLRRNWPLVVAAGVGTGRQQSFGNLAECIN
jgi:hypothetical protein